MKSVIKEMYEITFWLQQKLEEQCLHEEHEKVIEIEKLISELEDEIDFLKEEAEKGQQV